MNQVFQSAAWIGAKNAHPKSPHKNARPAKDGAGIEDSYEVLMPSVDPDKTTGLH